MRLAPLIPLPQNSLRLRLAYLVDDFLEQPLPPSPRPAIISCWRLGLRIAVNLLVAAFALALAAMVVIGGPIIGLTMAIKDPIVRWLFGINFSPTASCWLWPIG